MGGISTSIFDGAFSDRGKDQHLAISTKRRLSFPTVVSIDIGTKIYQLVPNVNLIPFVIQFFGVSGAVQIKVAGVFGLGIFLGNDHLFVVQRNRYTAVVRTNIEGLWQWVAIVEIGIDVCTFGPRQFFYHFRFNIAFGLSHELACVEQYFSIWRKQRQIFLFVGTYAFYFYGLKWGFVLVNLSVSFDMGKGFFYLFVFLFILLTNFSGVIRRETEKFLKIE